MSPFLKVVVGLIVAALLPLQSFADELKYRRGYTVQLLRFEDAILAVQKMVKHAQGEQPGMSEYNE